jgi:hypothetical protein
MIRLHRRQSVPDTASRQEEHVMTDQATQTTQATQATSQQPGGTEPAAPADGDEGIGRRTLLNGGAVVGAAGGLTPGWFTGRGATGPGHGLRVGRIVGSARHPDLPLSRPVIGILARTSVCARDRGRRSGDGWPLWAGERRP